MELISPKIAGFLRNSSWIRRMFEAGMELQKQYGVENVYDFSLGSPDLPPPQDVIRAIAALASAVDKPAGLGYMPNAGFMSARETLAGKASELLKIAIAPTDVIFSVGAAGALNVVLKSILSEGDEVVCPAPYFVEYGFYCMNHGGTLKPVPSEAGTFKLNIPGIAAAINEKTRALIINSPNNPTGVVYRADELVELGKILQAATEKYGRPIYLISDEPYRFLTYDGITVEPVFPHYKYSVLVSSFSKNLGLAGERVGYAIINPAIEGRQELMAAFIFANRTLGYVNAPCIGQRLAELCVKTTKPEISVYVERRQLMAQVLDAAGIEYQLPAGTFYFFPKVPGKSQDDVKFVAKLLEHRILAVPGSGFGFPGYFRLALCVDKRFITGAAAGFVAAAQEFVQENQ